MTVQSTTSANPASPAADEIASHPLRKVLGLRDLSRPGDLFECIEAAGRGEIFVGRLGSPQRITPRDELALGAFGRLP